MSSNGLFERCRGKKPVQLLPTAVSRLMKEKTLRRLGRSPCPFVDDVARVARTPIRKLGYDERFIRPIRELSERGLPAQALLEVLPAIFAYRDETDEQSVQLAQLLAEKPLADVVAEVTGLSDEALIGQILAQFP